MPERGAETTITVTPEPAFAWLADPRNAGAWFASVTLEQPPAPPLRAGSAWQFRLARPRARPMPMRMADYTPPNRFTWETTYPAWRDNLRWVFTLEPASAASNGSNGSDGSDGTGGSGGSDGSDGSGGSDGDGAPTSTCLRLAIEQRPGPLGWPFLALASLLERLSGASGSSAQARAQRALDRARDALQALPPTAFTAYGYPPPTRKRDRRRR